MFSSFKTTPFQSELKSYFLILKYLRATSRKKKISKTSERKSARSMNLLTECYIAFADYSDGMKPFHETPRRAFLQALEISCFSLVELSNAFSDLFTPNASVVTMSISTTQMASENYGYMAPIKAALDSSLAFLTKSFSSFSNVRFNAVAPSLLKTSASAGIPGYLDSYLYAEQVIPRKSPVQTEEAAAAVVFLLSPRSSGIVAQKIVVDAGMAINYFDKKIIESVVKEG